MPSRPFIVGTAGHIDHGKTTLVRALTGVDCDRLDEEKRRGITIVLGFASLPLPGDAVASIIDVPGHERFVRTMVAGAGGVDVGLLVVAADEGVMPQTREHVDVLKLLGVPEVVVALTRTDVADPDLIELAELDAQELLADAPWPDAPVVPTSAITGAGLDELRQELLAASRRLPALHASTGPFRLWADRSFSLRGHGTVVTGTTQDGSLQVGDTIEILPGGATARVRSLQVHGSAAPTVDAGARAALNLQGLDSAQAPAGSCAVQPGSTACSDRLDVSVELLAEGPRPLPNNATVRLLLGTAECLATVRMIAADGGPAPERCEPGGGLLAQLALATPLPARAGDRFVIRQESPMVTLGGGFVLDPEPALLKRRGRKVAAELLGVLAAPGSSLGERAVALLRATPGIGLDQRALARRLPPGADFASALRAAVESGSASAYGSDPPRWIATDVVPTWAPRASDFVVAHHRAHPLLDGPLLAEVRQALVPVPEARAFEALLPAIESTAGLQVRSGRLARPEHRASPSPEQRAVLDALVRRLHDGGTHPPPLATATSGLDLPPDALLWLVEQGELIKVADDFLVAREPYRTLVRALVRHARATGGLAPADFKELSGLTRRHAMPFLEHFDRERLTVRRADGRTLRDVPPWVDE